MTRGPVRTLCDEVEYPFFKKMESKDFLRTLAVHTINEIYRYESSKSLFNPLLSKEVIEIKEALDALCGIDRITDFNVFYEFMFSRYGGKNNRDAPYKYHLLYLSYALKISVESPENSRHLASAIRDIAPYLYDFKRADERTARFTKQFAWDIVHKSVESHFS